MSVDPAKIQLAKDNGILLADVAAQAAEAAGLAYAACCALLMQETGGGVNRYGHDPTQLDGFDDPVDESNYRLYKWQRDHKHMGNQGVGPVQLTAKSLQDAADALGGCWKPLASMTVGFGVLAKARAAGKSWHDTWLVYNPSETYADQLDTKFAWWKTILNP